ncbi:VgrG-related protein [Frankia sp. Cj5]|uniref:VgrG-related protein n=1 Tax=Frankia sp. Cj5 TaxID=2880978 RepID=UPI001EF4904F|nr:VgrG-related protein [Frankia sp. Cj5]
MAADNTYGALPTLYLDGQRVPLEVAERLRKVVVNSDLAAPDSCHVVLDDPGREMLARAGLEFRAALRVAAARPGETTGQTLFEGTIYSLGFGYDERGATATAVAYDSSYALFNGVHTATYANVTDSDLVRRIASEAGIATGTVEATSVVHDHVGQLNETHWEFLVRRAREIDYQLLIRAGKLDFVRPAEAGDGPQPGGYDSPDRLVFTPGGNLEVFSARVTAAEQVAEVEVRGWDDRNKRELVATAPARTRAARIGDAPADLARGGSASGAAPGSGGGSGAAAARHVTVSLPLATQAECDAAAVAAAERIASTSLAAEGVARGDPRLLAGVAVSVGQTGGRLDGRFTISHAEHVFAASGYRTRFTASGPHDRSLLGLTSAPRPRRPGIAGAVPAVVTNITDPENRGRVRVKLPWLSGDYESDWARVAMPGAGPDRGLLMLPEVDDEVLVVFEQGDPRRPFVLGGLHNGVDAPPFDGGVDGAAGQVVRRGLRSRKGHEIVVSDADGAEHIEILTSGGRVRILLDHDSGGLTVETAADVVVRARGKISMSADGDLDISARGKGSISADAGLTLRSGADVTVQGSVIKLN